MKGLELARKYWEELGRPAFEKECPQVLERACVGLAGEGSECFGFDDEFSRDTTGDRGSASGCPRRTRTVSVNRPAGYTRRCRKNSWALKGSS